VTFSGNSGNYPRPFNIVPDYYPDTIQDARFLRAGFVPSEVVHRDPEVNHLSNVLEPLARGETADTALITGSTGSGKTSIAKFTMTESRQENLDVDRVYVNC
jgi:Cdc6-like AAA superfamily ATPase